MEAVAPSSFGFHLFAAIIGRFQYFLDKIISHFPISFSQVFIILQGEILLPVQPCLLTDGIGREWVAGPNDEIRILAHFQ